MRAVVSTYRCDHMPLLSRQSRRDDLLQTVQTLERMVEQQAAEHAQLRAERDTLADCVRSLQELQQQPPAPTDFRAQVMETLGYDTLGRSLT